MHSTCTRLILKPHKRSPEFQHLRKNKPFRRNSKVPTVDVPAMTLKWCWVISVQKQAGNQYKQYIDIHNPTNDTVRKYSTSLVANSNQINHVFIDNRHKLTLLKVRSFYIDSEHFLVGAMIKYRKAKQMERCQKQGRKARYTVV